MSDNSALVTWVKTVNEISKFDRAYFEHMVAGVRAIHENPGSMLTINNNGEISIVHPDGRLERVAAFEGLPIQPRPRAN